MGLNEMCISWNIKKSSKSREQKSLENIDEFKMFFFLNMFRAVDVVKNLKGLT